MRRKVEYEFQMSFVRPPGMPFTVANEIRRGRLYPNSPAAEIIADNGYQIYKARVELVKFRPDKLTDGEYHRALITKINHHRQVIKSVRYNAGILTPFEKVKKLTSDVKQLAFDGVSILLDVV